MRKLWNNNLKTFNMYYLVVKNLGVEKCIDMNEEDIYTKNSFYNCKQEQKRVKKE